MRKIFLANLGFLIATVVIYSSPLSLNLSASLPQWVFLQTSAKPQLFSYVSFEKAGRFWKLIKQVKGVAGEKIEFKDGLLWVEDRCIGKVKYRSASGRTYHLLKDNIVPKGKLFVAGEHEASFDSRYEEFGFVDEGEVLACYEPLF